MIYDEGTYSFNYYFLNFMNRINVSVFILVFVGLFLFETHSAAATWTPEESFNSYSVGADLNGGSGGSGWSGNWVRASSPNNPIVAEASVTYDGSTSVRTTSNNAGVYRSLGSLTAGSLYVAMRKTSTSSGSWYLTLGDGSYPTDRMAIRAGTGGNIEIYDNNTGYQITAYNADQWYVINIEFDNTNHANQYRARVHDGISWSSFSSWYTVSGGSYSGIIYVSPQGDCSGITCYWDTIQSANPLS